jgi:thioredoxin reductase
MKRANHFEVIIVGGSYAGLSAAMALGRSLRKVLIIDSGLPCNRQTPHSHNFITHDGEAPASIAQKAKTQLLQYSTVEFFDGLGVHATKVDEGFVVTVQTGEEFLSKRLVLATGIRDLLPEIPGLAACWGITVIHCPYCHGYEFRGQRTAIMANGERAYHLATLVNNLTDKLTILTGSAPDFTSDQMTRLRAHQIEVVPDEVSAIIHEDGQVKQVAFSDGRVMPFSAIYAAVPFVQSSDIAASLGCQFTEQGRIQVDPMQKTTIEGVFACGDNASTVRSLASAVYSGNLAGAVINQELTESQF